MAFTNRSVARRCRSRPRKMTSEIPRHKTDLRRELRGRIAALSNEERTVASARARALLAAQEVWRAARSVLLYSPLRDELDLSAMLAEAIDSRKVVALPRFVPETGAYAVFQVTDPGKDCAPGKFGIAEPRDVCPPFDLNRLDLALVPGLGFDAAGRRLGRGGGYYDRLLSRVGGVKCGVAFDEQLVGQIPAEPHDIQVNFVLTPSRWLQTSGTPAALK
jgi:5-formyltetrahydrofolate cyclo-ligase